jgi:hypothetical protein
MDNESEDDSTETGASAWTRINMACAVYLGSENHKRHAKVIDQLRLYPPEDEPEFLVTDAIARALGLK